MSENIKNIEDKYGRVLFGMALTHLFDVGVRNLTDENVKNATAQIKANDGKIKAKGGYSIMTAEFQIKIINCAAELAKYDVWDLLCYVKENLEISVIR